MVAISVQDTGIGIKHTEDLFQMFSRLSEGHELCVEGVGLGLYISSELTIKQGGTVCVKSIPGKGSTFTVQLPINCINKK